MCLRFGAMILTSMVFMYWVMFVGSWELSHVRLLDMYRSVKGNIAAVASA